jgi:hypothetical protein
MTKTRQLISHRATPPRPQPLSAPTRTTAPPAAHPYPPPRCHPPGLRRGSQHPYRGRRRRSHASNAHRRRTLRVVAAPEQPPPLRKGSSQPTKEGPLTTSQGRRRMSPNRRRCHAPQDSTPMRGAPDPSTYDPPLTPLAADLPSWRWGCCLPMGGTIGGDCRLLRGRTGTGTTTRCPAPQSEVDVPSRKTWIGSRDPHDAALVRRETPAATIPASRMGCVGDDTTEG